MRNEWVGGDAHADNHLVNVDSVHGTLYGNRTAAARGIRLTQFHFLKSHLTDVTLLVTKIFDGVMKCQKLHALFLGMLHLFCAGRHLFFAAAVYNHGAFGSQTAGSTYRVHCSVATTYHSHPAATKHGGIAFGVGSIHEVDARQVFVRRHDADEVLSGDIHKVGQSGSAGGKDTLEAFFMQVVVAYCLAHDAVFHEPYTHLAKALNLYVHYLVGQTELGDAILQYTTNLV